MVEGLEASGDTEVHTRFGGELRIRREKAGLTQEQLAEAAGLSVDAVSALERGVRSRPRGATVDALARGLRLGLADRQALQEAARFLRRRGVGPAAGTEVAEPRSPLFGRSIEVEEGLAALLQGLGTLTLTGPPGVGKSRIAVEVSRRARSVIPRVGVVDLAGICDPQQVPAAIERELNCIRGATRPNFPNRCGHEDDRDTILVLDNFEHVLSAARYVAQLASRRQNLRVLVTSRIPLRLRDERVLVVGALPTDVALDMLIERIRTRNSRFEASPSNLVALRRICDELDGLPLAIELVARWMSVMEPQALLARISDPLDLLVDGSSDLPERQKSLRATLRWSYELLTPVQRQLFRMLSVCSDGAGLDVVSDLMESVAGAGARNSALTVVASLIEQNLLTSCPDPAVPRFKMLRTVRAFAHEVESAAEDIEDLRKRHAERYLAMARQARRDLVGPGQGKWLECLSWERRNILSALAWARNHHEDALGVEIIVHLRRFWEHRGYTGEGYRWLAPWLADEVRLPTELKAEARKVAGVLAWRLGKDQEGLRWCLQSLELYESADDRRGVDTMLNNLGLMAWCEGRLGSAISYWERSLDNLRKLKSRAEVTINHLGQRRLTQHDLAAHALEVVDAAIRLRLRLDHTDAHANAVSLTHLGALARYAQQPVQARGYLSRAMEEWQALRNESGVGSVLTRLGDLSRDQGEALRSVEYYQDSLEVLGGAGDGAATAQAVDGLALCAWTSGDRRSAKILCDVSRRIRDLFGRALPSDSRIGHVEIQALELGAGGELCRTDRPGESMELAGMLEVLGAVSSSFRPRGLEGLLHQLASPVSHTRDPQRR